MLVDPTGLASTLAGVTCNSTYGDGSCGGSGAGVVIDDGGDWAVDDDDDEPECPEQPDDFGFGLGGSYGFDWNNGGCGGDNSDWIDDPKEPCPSRIGFIGKQEKCEICGGHWERETASSIGKLFCGIGTASEFISCGTFVYTGSGLAGVGCGLSIIAVTKACAAYSCKG